MPIILSQFPETNTAFNVNEVSKNVIQSTFKKGKRSVIYKGTARVIRVFQKSLVRSKKWHQWIYQIPQK
jgi:hypothetical protein